MKILLLVSAALTIALPVQADSVWLIMKEVVVPISSVGRQGMMSMEKVEMNSMEQCEEQGAKYISSKRLGTWRDFDNLTGFECIEGK